jgi:hypothetical protein
MALSDALSDAEDEIGHYLNDPFYGDPQTGMYAGPMLPYVQKLLTEIAALRVYYDTEPDVKLNEKAFARVVNAFSAPLFEEEKA